MFSIFLLYLRIFPRSDKMGCVQGGTALLHLVTPCSVEVTGMLALFQREMEEQWIWGRGEVGLGLGGGEGGEEAALRIYIMREE